MSFSTWVMLFVYVFLVGGSSIYTMIHTMLDREK